MKPTVLMVGADKGGVGKTTVSRTVLDYLGAKNTHGSRVRCRTSARHVAALLPRITEVVDVTTAAGPDEA